MKDINREQEEKRIKDNLWRARAEGSEATLTLEQWLETIELFNGLCAYCKTNTFDTLDHLIPISNTGGTVKDNCVPACKSCNSKKGNKLSSRGVEGETVEEAVVRVWSTMQPKTRLFISKSTNKKQVGMRLTPAALFLADKIALAMGDDYTYIPDRTAVVERAILELGRSELQRGRITQEDWQEYERLVQRRGEIVDVTLVGFDGKVIEG